MAQFSFLNPNPNFACNTLAYVFARSRLLTHLTSKAAGKGKVDIIMIFYRYLSDIYFATSFARSSARIRSSISCTSAFTAGFS